MEGSLGVEETLNEIVLEQLVWELSCSTSFRIAVKDLVPLYVTIHNYNVHFLCVSRKMSAAQEEELCRADVIRDVRQALNLLNKGVDPNCLDIEQNTPLIHASRAGSTDVVEVLLDYGARMDATDNNGWTALMYAAQEAHPKIVKLLVSNGCQVSSDFFHFSSFLIF